MRVDDWVGAALYDPDDGFYMTGGRAGRRGDFLTAPEVGPLFGAVLARAVDEWWIELGRPGSFPVFEVGAGPGTLARSVLRADGEAARSGALRWWAVETSPAQRQLHPRHDLLRSVATLDEASSRAWDDGGEVGVGVVLANELLDNLPFRILERGQEGWREVRVDSTADDRFEATVAELAVDTERDLERVAPDAEAGVRVPWQAAARSWIESALETVPGGRVVVFDYGASTPDLAGREGGWLRTHTQHTDVVGWLDDPGGTDITTDVAFDQMQLDREASLLRTQAEFLRHHGVDEMVEDGKRIWLERAHIGDLQALEARSRVREAEALCDEDGMGSFLVAEWGS